MSDFKAKMHKIRLPLGLRPRPEGAYGAPQTPLLYLRGRLLRGWWGKLLPYILLEEYTYILALEMASPRNLHCASCIGTLSSPIPSIQHAFRRRRITRIRQVAPTA